MKTLIIFVNILTYEAAKCSLLATPRVWLYTTSGVSRYLGEYITSICWDAWRESAGNILFQHNFFPVLPRLKMLLCIPG